MEREGGNMVFDILVVLLAAAGVAFLIKLALGLLLMPVRGKGCRVFVAVSIERDAPDLERVVRGAKWLSQQGGVELLLVDKGMDERTREVANRLAHETKCTIYTMEELMKDPDAIL
jgi:hypothetical protein